MSKKEAVIIGQAPAEHEYSIPFKRTRLYKWFGSHGCSEQDILESFHFEALVNSFPGKSKAGHAKPSETAIKEHIPTLCKLIRTQNIKLIVPVGKMAIEHVLRKKVSALSDCIGQTYNSIPFGELSLYEILIIPLPHPSGLSSWQYQGQNNALLNSALAKIATHVQTNQPTLF